MAFCSECGYNIGDSKVCPICHTVNDNECDDAQYEKIDVSQTTYETESVVLSDVCDEQTVPVLLEEQFRTSRNKKGILFGCVVIVLATLIILFVNFCDSPKSITDKTLNAIKDADINTLVQTVPYEHIYEDSNIDYVSSIRNSYLQLYDVAFMRIKVFSDIDLNQITWEIKKVKDCDEDELEQIQDYWDDNFDVSVKNAKIVKVKIKDGMQDEIINFTVIKIGGKWYMADNPLTFFNN